MKHGNKTDAERELEEQEAAARLDYRFISSSSVGASSNGEPSMEMGSNQNITEYMRDVKAQGRREESLLIDNSDQALALQQAEKGKGLGDSEEAMPSNDEVAVQSKFYHWQDKYRPRKPR